MHEVTLKINSLKLKILELLRAFESIREENKSLKKTVVLLEEKIQKIESVKSENKSTEELKIKIGESIQEIDEVIKLLS